MGKRPPPKLLEIAGREVKVSSPDKLYFAAAGVTKLDLVNYYLAVGEGALRGIRGRPFVMKRYVRGIDEDFFFQKRAPKSRPDWVETAVLRFPSGRTAEEVVINDLAQLVWVVNLGCVDLNPHPTRVPDLEHPDELRVDLDPCPGVEWPIVRHVAKVVHEVLDDHALVGWPKTSGSRGIHINVRIEPLWGFQQVRQAALALAREVERRAPAIATSKWWKEERHGVFLDYNQNAKDRTVASAYSVRPLQDARVSMPLRWDEVAACDPARWTVFTVPERFAAEGDASEGIDETAGSLDGLLDLAGEQAAAGQEDAPWPPHYQKQPGEPPRVQPSRAKGSGRREPKFPLLTISKAKKKDDALAGLERWKARWADAAGHLAIDDVLVDSMRGRSTTWTRIRVNLRNVPEETRPPKEPQPSHFGSNSQSPVFGTASVRLASIGSIGGSIGYAISRQFAGSHSWAIVAGMERAVAFAPATIANLGPGFDVLGLAVQGLGDWVTAALVDEPGVRLAAASAGVPTHATRNTAGIAAIETARLAGVDLTRVGIELRVEKGMPVGSGLGSSAASAAAGATAVNALLGSPLPTEALIGPCVEAEAAVSGRHADNVAPSLLGGLVLIRSVDPLDVVRLPVPPGLHVVVVTPDYELATADARAALPESVPLSAMVRNTANVAALVSACYAGDLALLGRAMEDTVVAPVRARLIPGAEGVLKAARDGGALGASISGAGPSIFALTGSEADAHALAPRLCSAFGDAGLGATALVSSANAPGSSTSEEESSAR